MSTAIRRIGNASGVILPKPALAALGVTEGGRVEVVYQPGRITLLPSGRRAAEAGRAEDPVPPDAEALTEEDREWLEADLGETSLDDWDAATEEDRTRVEAELLASGIVTR